MFVGFPSIESFHTAVRAVKACPTLAPGKVTYRPKIKLHGTNAAVRIKGGEIYAQSRTQIITPKSDNAGFAAWLEGKKAFFKNVASQDGDCTIFGEWCGPGIMKGTAINQLPSKIFAIFAVVLDDGDMIICPDEFNRMIRRVQTDDKITDVHVLPWHGDPITVDFQSREQLTTVAETLNRIVKEIEPCDPWVKETFGIEGTAEGLVYYPGADGAVITKDMFAELAFKAKGEKHKVVKTKESVQVDPEVAASIDEFVAMFLTEPRLEQGVVAVDGIEISKIGKFLKWISTDVHKESADELSASELTWEQVQKQVQTAARNWYITKCQTI